MHPNVTFSSASIERKAWLLRIPGWVELGVTLENAASCGGSDISLLGCQAYLSFWPSLEPFISRLKDQMICRLIRHRALLLM